MAHLAQAPNEEIHAFTRLLKTRECYQAPRHWKDAYYRMRANEQYYKESALADALTHRNTETILAFLNHDIVPRQSLRNKINIFHLVCTNDGFVHTLDIL